eukprot:3033135-Rhodomonas_salina.1
MSGEMALPGYPGTQGMHAQVSGYVSRQQNASACCDQYPRVPRVLFSTLQALRATKATHPGHRPNVTLARYPVLNAYPGSR